MKEKTTLQKYNYYKDVLDKIADFPINKIPIIKDLNLSRGVIQAAYKEMYKIDFVGTIIDYLCWISTLYILEKTKEDYKSETFETYIRYIRNKNRDTKDYRNLLRFYSKSPSGTEKILSWIKDNFDFKVQLDEIHFLLITFSNDWIRYYMKELDVGEKPKYIG